jgi:hypothetical protein
MGTFAGTAIIDYRFPFASQGKQTLVFPFPFATNKHKFAFPFSVCSKQTEVAVSAFRIYIYIYVETAAYVAVSNGQRKMEAQAIFLNTYFYHSLIVQTEVCRLSVC